MTMAADWPTLARHAALLHALAREEGILIGTAGHVLQAVRDPSQRRSKRLHQFETMLSAVEYVGVFPVVEFSHRLSALPAPQFIHAMNDTGLRNTWRIVVTDVASEERYFLRDEWPLAVAAICESPAPAAIVLALGRTCEFSAAHLERLIEISSALRPMDCLLEFEHHSWSAASRVLAGAGVAVVQVDAPTLPGIVKRIPLPGRHAHLRLVGRNGKEWFEHQESERFCHDYTNAELSAVASRVGELRTVADTVTVVFANHPPASALENAVKFARLFGNASP